MTTTFRLGAREVQKALDVQVVRSEDELEKNLLEGFRV